MSESAATGSVPADAIMWVYSSHTYYRGSVWGKRFTILRDEWLASRAPGGHPRRAYASLDDNEAEIFDQALGQNVGRGA